MKDYCMNCQGLIMKPDVSYGYGGPVCICKNIQSQGGLISHSCKDTCSGWQQGYETGVKAKDISKEAWLEVIEYLKSMQQIGTAKRVEDEMKRRGIG